MRFETSAGAAFEALTADVTDGAVNAEHESLNPIAALSPMVGRTPEYLGKKIGGREAKLALIALLVHPLMILFLPVAAFRLLADSYVQGSTKCFLNGTITFERNNLCLS